MLALSNISRRHSRGFTLVELLLAMVLLSILGVAAFSRLPDTGSYQDAVMRDGIVTSVRLAQRSALSHHTATTRWQLAHLSAGGWQYRVSVAGVDQLLEDAATDASLSYQGNSSAGAFDKTLAADSSIELRFDRLGNVTHLDDGTLYPLTSSVTLTFSDKTICVSLSGYAYVGVCT